MRFPWLKQVVTASFSELCRNLAAKGLYPPAEASPLDRLSRSVTAFFSFPEVGNLFWTSPLPRESIASFTAIDSYFTGLSHFLRSNAETPPQSVMGRFIDVLKTGSEFIVLFLSIVGHFAFNPRRDRRGPLAECRFYNVAFMAGKVDQPPYYRAHFLPAYLDRRAVVHPESRHVLMSRCPGSGKTLCLRPGLCRGRAVRVFRDVYRRCRFNVCELQEPFD
jgi:hypothetical protein